MERDPALGGGRPARSAQRAPRAGARGCAAGDALEAPADPRPEAVDHLLHRRGVDTIDFEQWRRIDRLELTLGKEQGRPRVKLVSRSDLLSAANDTLYDPDEDPGITVPIPTQDDD